MASCRNMNMIACLSLMVVTLGLMKGEAAVQNTYVVGDSSGWTLPPNTSFYSDWAASKTFQIGDVVTFNWTGNHDVILTTKEEYDNCSSLRSGILWTNSPVQQKLGSAGPLYFYCTVGDHCEQGMKVTINVESSTTSPPSGAHASVASSILGLISSALVISFFTCM